MFDICIVGHICTDILAKPIEQLPPKGQLIFIDNLRVVPGGCGLNPAVYLGNMRVSTAILGKTGEDALGDFVVSTFKQAGVNYTGLRRDTKTATSATVVTIDHAGERTLMHYLGTNGTLCFEDIDMDIVLNSRILFIGGTFLMPAFDGEDTAKVLRQAKQKGIICALDTAWDASRKWMETIEECLPYLDWFLPSYEEAVELSKEKDVDKIAGVFLGRGVKSVVIKLGADGCYVNEGSSRGYYVPPLENVTVVDTSGAGDAFCSGFLAGLSMGWNPKACAELGNTVGALCVTEIGTITAARSFEEVLKFKKQHQ